MHVKMKKQVSKKTIKPTYVVDITKCEDLYDTALAFAVAKQKAGQPLSDENLDIIITKAVDDFAETLSWLGFIDKKNHFIESMPQMICVCEKKKLPWYKRLWNKLKHPFAR